MSGRWLSQWPDGRDPHAPLAVVFPPAGAGCNQFRAWSGLVGPSLSIAGVQLPGREERWNDVAPRNVDQAVQEISEALLARRGDGPLLLVGHSFGALLAFEVAHQVSAVHLTVSASRSPEHWHGHKRGISTDPDELDRLIDVNSLPENLRTPEIRELMVSMMAADANLSQTYVRPTGRPLLDIPVDIWSATLDTTVSGFELNGWGEITTGPSIRFSIDGGHHAILRDPRPLLERLEQVAATVISEVSA